MRRSEFTARTAAMYAAWNQNAPEIAVSAALALAEELEKNGVAPWAEPTEQELLMDTLPERFKKIMDNLGYGPLAPRVPEAFLGTAVLEVKTPSAVKSILSDVAKGLPVNAALPPGKWELGFRPVSETPGGLVLPSK